MKIEFYLEKKLKNFFWLKSKKDNNSRFDIDLKIEGFKEIPVQTKFNIEE